MTTRRWTVAERHEFGRRMQESREALGLSKAEVAAGVQRSPTSIGTFEKGYAQPSEALCWRICRFLDIEVPVSAGFEPPAPWMSGAPSVAAIVCCEDEALGLEGEHSFDCPRARRTG